MILDCYDGVLARAKKLSSPRGRTLDELGDAVAYIAICIGMGDPRPPHASRCAAACRRVRRLVLAPARCRGHAYDFYKRRLGSALKEGRDAIAEELEQKHELVRSGAPSGSRASASGSTAGRCGSTSRTTRRRRR